ncbi:APG9-domain-containing protein [Trichodelitschia bisporula]|uniref:Autophagy-related protein 9 n=1 Tax=Trichodelitschia bisporula TaxID=703511 RepID=A0A6G1I1U6_9PEZI|nr:APG9-domain-containing protein [Trichodelitschia bisporula]
MASNILSRLLPSASDEGQPDGRFISHTRTRSTASDIEAAAAMAIDEANLGEQFQEQDLEQLLAEENDLATESTAFLPDKSKNKSGKGRADEKWKRQHTTAGGPASRIEEDEDVPESLLFEGQKGYRPGDRTRQRASSAAHDAVPVPGPETHNTRAQWNAARAQQPLHPDRTRSRTTPARQMIRALGADPKQKALWKWANVENLDVFLKQVYEYYAAHGIWSIVLQRVISVLSGAFIIGFSTFLLFCIDYSLLPHRTSLDEIRIKQCTRKMPTIASFVLWVSAVWWVYTLISFIRDIPRLWDMKNFYEHLLDIPDCDIQTVSWQYVVAKLMLLRNANPHTAQNMSSENRRFLRGQSKQRMDAHDIANRLMRKENYWIGIINKEILDTTVNIPFIGKYSIFTRVIEWNIGLCLMDFVFDDQSQVKEVFLKSQSRRELVEILKRRFFIIGVFSIFFSPILAFYFFVIQFFTNFTEYQKNPSELGARSFSPLAEWKFREFNELYHIFRRRKTMAFPYANTYLDQFPKDKMDQASKFVAFISGALAAVLGVISLLDPELFLGFEIAGKTVLFWLGVFGTVYMATRPASLHDEMVLDPEHHLKRVIECTHYYPESWQKRLHTDEVRQEFSTLYQLKIILFLQELASVILTPFVFLISLPRCAEALIDFIREFTIHVDGLGHVCSFAIFDFKRPGDPPRRLGAPGLASPDLRADYYAAKDNKLLESYYSFLDHYAPNPRRGLAPRRKGAGFNLPPQFPGLAAEHVNRDPQASRGVLGAHPEPMHSILLDPHHQPQPRAPPQARQRLRGPSGLVAGAGVEEEEGPVPAERTGRSEQAAVEDDSELGDSWAVRADTGGEPERREPEAEGGAGAGVLGLLYQFQKAQAEGRHVHL